MPPSVVPHAHRTKLESLEPVSTDHIRLIQFVINSYHKRLMQDWIDSTDPPERVPDNHRSPPKIDEWPRVQMWQVLGNYLDFLELHPREWESEKATVEIAWMLLGGHALATSSMLEAMVNQVEQEKKHRQKFEESEVAKKEETGDGAVST